MAIDEKAAQDAVYNLLSAMEIDFSKHSDIDKTPARVVKMLSELWEGERYTNEDIAAMFGKTFESDVHDIVIVSNIPYFSYCEHHLALIYDLKISIGYLPNGKIIGLSKIARIADMVCRRLQLQEKICNDILDVIKKIIGDDVIVYAEGKHSCLTARGIKKFDSVTKTLATSGVFYQKDFQQNFFNLIRC